jgi:hypothetical protein
MFVLCINCDIFNPSSSDDTGWKKVSLPRSLLGVWYVNEIPILTVSSKSFTISNRIWVFMYIDKNDAEEYRIVVVNLSEYRAYYVRNITEHSVEIAVGMSAYNAYNAKNADRDTWLTLTR